MNHQEKLAFIRSKAIEANPEIVELKFGCDIEILIGSISVPADFLSRNYAGNFIVFIAGEKATYKEKQVHKIIGRPITIADVLLAISEKCGGMLSMECVDQHGTKENHLSRVVGRLLKLWNLRKDDLNEQDEETISFLYDVLK